MNLRRRVAVSAAVMAIALAALPAFAEVREEFHKTVPIDQNGTFTLKNVNGGVSVDTWDRPEVQIDAVKTGRSKEKLDEARIEVSGGGHAVDVRTKYPEHSNNSAAVEYTIHLPRTVRLDPVETVNGSVHVRGVTAHVKAQSVNGQVEVQEVAGDLDLSSVNGNVVASLRDLGTHPVRMNVVNGSLRLTLPGAANAHVHASTVNGSIETQFPISVEHPRFGPGSSFDGQIGSGGADVHLESVNGSIHLLKS